MKKQSLLLSLTAIALSAWVIGCKEEPKAASEAVKEPPKAASTAVSAATDKVKETVAAAKETGAKVVENVKTAGTQAVATVTEKAKEVAEGKFADALAKLKETNNASPSGEQQSVIANLKAQIEKAMSATSGAISSATNALNNFLKK